MSRLLSGLLIIVGVILINTVVAFVEVGITSGSVVPDNLPGCSTSDNATECHELGKTSFLAAVAGVTFTGFDGAPTVFNVLWGVVMSLLLVGGVLLIALSFIPFTSG